MLHHLLQEFHDHLGGWPHQDLALATLLGIEDAAKAVVEHRDTHHDSCGPKGTRVLSVRAGNGVPRTEQAGYAEVLAGIPPRGKVSSTQLPQRLIL